MSKQIIEQVREFVKKECEKPEAHYKGAFDKHFVNVVRNARELSKQQNVDEEIVEISAWLHDIGSIVGRYEDHHIASAEIADEFLKSLGIF